MNKEIKKVLLEMSKDFIDNEVKNDGFIRRQNSLLYTKKIGNIRQKIIMNVESYYSTYKFVYPFYSVSIPEVIETARKMTENDPIFNRIITDSTKEVISEPVQCIAKTEMWMLDRNQNREQLSFQICEYFKQHVIPLLKDLESIDDFINLYEYHDNRIIMDDTRYLYIASAYIAKKEYAKAFNVLDSRLDHKLHVAIFQYIEDLL